MKSKRLLVFFVVLFIAFFVGLKFSPKVSSQSAGVTLGAWQATAEFPGFGHPYPSFARNGFFYVHTTNDRDVYYAAPQANGNITSWNLAWNDHGGLHGFVAINVDGAPYHFRNGHIARYNMQADGTINDVTTQESSMDSSFEGRLWVWDTAVSMPLTSAKYVFHLGGFSCPGSGCAVSYRYDGAIFKSSVPIGDHFTNTGKVHPDYSESAGSQQGPGKSVAYVPNGSASYGFIYTTRNKGDKLWRIQVNADGLLGDWSQVGTLPQGTGNQRGDLFVINNTLFVIRGSKVFKTALDVELGGIGAWDDSPPDLPEDQVEIGTWGGEAESSSWGIIGNYIYVTGPHKVYYAQINGDGGITPTVTVAPTPTGHACPTQARIGDYDCSGVVNAVDFDAWKTDFLASRSTLSFFEYFRRAFAW